MAYELANEDKIGIINGRLRSIATSVYDVNLSIEEENSIQNPNPDVLNTLNSRLADLNTRKAVLEEKLEELE